VPIPSFLQTHKGLLRGSSKGDGTAKEGLSAKLIENDHTGESKAALETAAAGAAAEDMPQDERSDGGGGAVKTRIDMERAMADPRVTPLCAACWESFFPDTVLVVTGLADPMLDEGEQLVEILMHAAEKHASEPQVPNPNPNPNPKPITLNP